MTSGVIGSSFATAATGHWKPVTSGSTGGGVAASTAAGKDDAVSVSKLGQALNGVAADIFKHLDSKARGALEGLVTSGRISAEDAVTGLRSLAARATFDRYVNERPKDAEDDQRLADHEAAWTKMQAYGSQNSNAINRLDKTTSALQDAQERGEISTDEQMERLQQAREEFKGEVASARAAHGTLEDKQAVLTDAGGFTKNVNGFKAAMSSSAATEELAALHSAEGHAAEKKLHDLGFDAKVFGDAFKSFAASVDIPGIGPSGKAPPRDETGAAGAAPEPAAAAQVNAVRSDPSNARAAVSLLQSALGAGAKAAGPSGAVHAAGENASDRSLDAMLALLKSGRTSGSDGV